MARVAYAVRRLLQQVDGSVVGDPDGFGVHRSVSVDPEYAEALGRDRRVAAVTVAGGEALVDLVTGRDADRDHPFDLG